MGIEALFCILVFIIVLNATGGGGKRAGSKFDKKFSKDKEKK